MQKRAPLLHGSGAFVFALAGSGSARLPVTGVGGGTGARLGPQSCVVSRAPVLADRGEQAPERVKYQPQGETETERQKNPFGRQRKGRHPIAEGGSCEPRIRVKSEIPKLMKQSSVQGVQCGLQALDGGDKRLDGGALRMKSRVATRQVILNEQREIAVKILVSDLLPGGEIEPRLVESTAEPLDVLRDEARHEAACDDGGEQQQPIDQATYEPHGNRASERASDITPAPDVRA